MIVSGKDVIVMIDDGGFKLYGCASSCSLSLSTSMIETSSVGSGLYSTFRPQKHGFTATISGLLNLDDPTALTLYDLRQKQLAMTQVLVKFTRTDAAGNEYVSGFDAYITGSTDSGDANGAASFDIDLQGTGELVETSSSVVKICNQTWMTRNWDGTTFRNGDTIPYVEFDPTIWAALTTPAWSYSSDNLSNIEPIRGKQYNWFAINDIRGFAPSGWRVPNETDFQDISNCLVTNVGGKLKQVGTTAMGFPTFITPNTNATNETGFNGIANTAFWDGFANLSRCRFWMSEQIDATNAKTAVLNFNDGNLGFPLSTQKWRSCTVRLIKDI